MDELTADLTGAGEAEVSAALERFCEAIAVGDGKYLGAHQRPNVYRFELGLPGELFVILPHGLALIFTETAAAGGPSDLWALTVERLSPDALAEIWMTNNLGPMA